MKEEKRDYSSYRKGYHKRNLKLLSDLDDLRKKVYRETKKIADLLASRYNANLVVLFGSFAKGTHRMNSDVDIAVEGINTTEFLRAWAFVDQLTDLSVDLRCLEDFPASSRKLILEQGVVFYEKRTNSDSDSRN